MSLPVSSSAALDLAMKSGNVQMQKNVQIETMELSAESKAQQEQHNKHMRKFNVSQRARSIIVPTSVDEVKAKLRLFGHPATFFGEGPADRRKRLQEVVAEMEMDDEDDYKRLQEILNTKAPELAGSSSSGMAAAAAASAAQSGMGAGKSSPAETVYTRANEALVRTREELCGTSFKRARQRLLRRQQDAERLSKDVTAREADVARVQAKYDAIDALSLSCSEISGRRPGMGVRYSSQGTILASHTLSEDVRLWDSGSLQARGALQGHTERVTGVAWTPKAGTDADLLLSTSADATCRVWRASTPDAPCVQTLSGHAGIVAMAAWHPDGALVASAGHDSTWRLWSIENGQELLCQDGISQQCSAVDFHPDGSLVATGDWAGTCLLWDLRSGKRLHAFQGHGKKVVKCTFAPDGWRAATCSPDNTVRVWDLRQTTCEYSIPAHAKAVTDVRFSPQGETVVTSSFDGTLRVWGTRDYRLLKTLKGHSDKVMGCDVDPRDGVSLASAGFDKYVKVWMQDE